MAGEGKRYSAGAIFLQVVPVFANVQRAIEDESKNIDRALGDQMEKSGERAGERAGKAATEAIEKQVKKLDIDKDLERQFRDSVYGINKALDGVDTSKLGKKLRADLKDLRGELDAIRNTDLTVDDNFDKVKQRLGGVVDQLDDMKKRSKVVLDLDGIPQFNRKLAEAQASIKAIDGDIKLDVDTKPAERAMGRFEKQFKKTTKRAAESLSSSVNPEIKKIATELKYLENLRIGVDISGNRARAELKEIQADLERLSGDDADIDVRVDTMAALRDLATFEAAMRKIDGEDVEVKVDVDSSGFRNANHDAERAANSFRSFNIILLAVSSAGPALVPVLAAIAGGLVALGPASAVAVAGLGSVLVGFSGIGDALTALGNQQDHAATTAQSAANRQSGAANQIRNAQEALADAERNAARAAEDAADRVADARRSAARAAEDAADRVADAREQAADAIKDALKAQKDAQEEYRDAVEEVADAEQALRDARAEAQKDAETLARRQRQNAVDERQAVMDLFDAQVNFNAVMADGASTATDKENASIDLEQAQIALNDTRYEQQELAAEAADYAENGVDGSDKVKDAQDAVTEALEAQKEAQEAVKEAAEAADEARVDGAEAVNEALKDQKEILSDNARAIRRALEDQAESHDDNARAIARAKQALSDARRQATDDLAQIDSQAQAVEAAFDKLGPAGKTFALFLFSLREGFYEFRDAVQEVMLPAVQEAIEGFMDSANASKARDMIVELARGFGEFTKALSISFQGPAWAAFFEMMATLGPQIQAAYGDAFISFMEALASLLATAGPFALRFAEGLADMMGRFAEWAASESGQQKFLDFLAYAEEVGPSVLAFIGALAGAVVKVAEAFAPYGEMVLHALTAILDFIANNPTAFLSALLTGATVVLFASQLAYGVMNLMMAGAALFATTVGPWVFLIVGLVIALGVLYKTNEDFANFIDKAWGRIKEIFSDAWKNHIKPALDNLWDAFQNLWDNVLKPFFAWLGPIIMWVIETILPRLLKGFAEEINGIAWLINKILVPVMTTMGDIIAWVWNNVIKPTWDALSAATSFLWNYVFKPVFGFIAAIVSTVFGGIKAVWERVLWPVIKTVGKVVWTLYKTYFKVAFVLALAAWKALSIGIRWAWNNILKPVWDAVQTAATWLWKNALKPAFDGIKTAWDQTARGFKSAWDKWGQPLFDWIVDNVLPPFKSAWETTIGAIGDLWEGLKALAATPIKFIIEKVINEGIIDGFNKVADWVGRDGFDHISTPGWMKGYATGGILPGYTPGRDVHTFRSPTAGTLALSGGEAIMRPEWTAAMGPDYVNRMNALARRGGTKAVREATMGLGGYWNGGVLPLLGGSVSSHGSSYGHPAYDLNYPGYDDYGKPVRAWKSGVLAQKNYVGDTSYGRWAVVNHDGGLSSLYAHLSAFSDAIVGQMVRAGQTIGYVGDLGNTGNPPTSHLHFEIKGGNVDFADSGDAGTSKPKRNIPGWLMDVVKDPLGAFKGWATAPLAGATDMMKNSELFKTASTVPLMLGKKVVDKVWDVVPGWVKTAAGWAGDGADWVVGGVKNAADAVADTAGDIASSIGNGAQAVGNFLGFAEGGILPYNGTMMYDNGGYLPPGMTTVMNLTGKPEPVFTADQFDGMGIGGGGDGFTYAPTFQGSNLTAADVVDDLDFARRKIQREGRYGRNR